MSEIFILVSWSVVNIDWYINEDYDKDHEKVKYPCQQSDKVFTQQRCLNTRIESQSVHENTYEATQKTHLRTHKMRKHQME